MIAYLLLALFALAAIAAVAGLADSFVRARNAFVSVRKDMRALQQSTTVSVVALPASQRAPATQARTTCARITPRQKLAVAA